MTTKSTRWLSRLTVFIECLWDWVLVFSVIAGIAFLYLAFFGFEKSIGNGTIAWSHSPKDFVLGVLLGFLAIVFVGVLQSRFIPKAIKRDTPLRGVGTVGVLVSSLIGWFVFLIGGCNWICIDSKEVSTGFLTTSQRLSLEQVDNVSRLDIVYRSELGPLSYLYAPRFSFGLISTERVELWKYPVSYVEPELCEILKEQELMEEYESENRSIHPRLSLESIGIACFFYIAAKTMFLLGIACLYLSFFAKHKVTTPAKSAKSIEIFAIAKHRLRDIFFAFAIGYGLMLFCQPAFVLEVPPPKSPCPNWHIWVLQNVMWPLALVAFFGLAGFWVGKCNWIRIDHSEITLGFLSLVIHRIDFRQIESVTEISQHDKSKKVADIEMGYSEVVRVPACILGLIETQFRQLLEASGVLVIDQDAGQGFKDFTDAVDRAKSGKDIESIRDVIE